MGILEVTGCRTTTGGMWNGAQCVAASPDTIDKDEEAENTNTFWGKLDREDDEVTQGWTGAAIEDCDKIELVSGSNENMQIYPHLVNWYTGDWTIPPDPEGVEFTWYFDGTVDTNMTASDAVYVMYPGQLVSAQWGQDVDGFRYLTARIGRYPGATQGSALITLQQDCVRSANCNTLRMKAGNVFHGVLQDNSAACVVGGGVVNGVAYWDIDWMLNTDHWVVEVDSLDTWVPRATVQAGEHTNGHYEVEVGGGFSKFQIVEYCSSWPLRKEC